MTFLAVVGIAMLFLGIMLYGTTAGLICYLCGYAVLIAWGWLLESRLRNIESGVHIAVETLVDEGIGDIQKEEIQKEEQEKNIPRRKSKRKTHKEPDKPNQI